MNVVFVRYERTYQPILDFLNGFHLVATTRNFYLSTTFTENQFWIFHTRRRMNFMDNK